METKNKHNRTHADQNGNSDFVIAGLLPVGKDNAISTKELVRITGCSSSRDLQQRISEERRAGAIICSSTTGGYFIPANREEMQEFYMVLKNRARNTLGVLKSVRRALKLPEGQQVLEVEYGKQKNV